MQMQARIFEKLKRGLSPGHLEVLDESSQHAGHAGARPGGETHFRVKIGAAAFDGKSRIACHRMINELLNAELQDGVHALAIEVVLKPPAKV